MKLMKFWLSAWEFSNVSSVLEKNCIDIKIKQLILYSRIIDEAIFSLNAVPISGYVEVVLNFVGFWNNMQDWILLFSFAIEKAYHVI